MSGRLEEKVAINTGAGQGIGAGSARVLAAAGAKVMVATRTASHGEATVEQIKEAGGTAAICAVDIGELENVERVVAATADKWGRGDIMVHNAASFLFGRVEGCSEDDLETVLSVNLKACFRLSKAVIPFFKERGAGRQLFTSSINGPRGHARHRLLRRIEGWHERVHENRRPRTGARQHNGQRRGARLHPYSSNGFAG